MSVSLEKTKAMHIHHQDSVSETTEEEVEQMKFITNATSVIDLSRQCGASKFTKAAGVAARRIDPGLDR